MSVRALYSSVMPTLASEPGELVDTIESLEEDDQIIINDRREPMTVTSVKEVAYEPIDLTFVECRGSRGGLYAIRIQRAQGELPDIGLMRYHKTKGRWVNASSGLMAVEMVDE